MVMPASLTLIRQCGRTFSTTGMRKHRVAVIGAAGGVGLPLSLVLKREPLVTALHMYDVVNMEGIAADMGHIDTNSHLEVYSTPNMSKALKCAEIVVIPAGVPRKAGMQRDDLFNMNADILKVTMAEIAKTCPKALIAIITNPVNSIVPLAAEYLKKANAYDPNRLFGVTTLDLCRARTFLADKFQTDANRVTIPVIGGHAGKTILPIMSQCRPIWNEDDEVTERFVKRVQEAGNEVVKAKAKHKGGSATVAMAHAAAVFVRSLCLGLKADGGATEYAYVESSVTKAKFFSTALLLGKNGIVKNYGLPKLNKCETEQLKEVVSELEKEIKKGIDHANK